MLELLRQSSHDIIALVRPDAQLDAESRLRRALVRAAELYDATDVLDQLPRCRVVAASLTEPDGEIASSLNTPVSEVWHAAASLQFEDRHREQIRATNVEGTRRMVELAQRLGSTSFNYISTAYVAGRANGLIHELDCSEAETNNHYERSKIDAEQIVAASPLRARILRPSIVVGHSRTLAATSFSGYYGFMRQVAQFRGLLERTQRGLLARSPVRLRIDADAEANLIPVDCVAREAVAIGARASSEGIYHLTHSAAPTVGDSVRTIFELLELPEPIFTQTRDDFSWLDQQFDKRMGFYGSYITGSKRFDRTRADAALGAHMTHPPILLAPLGAWYLQVFQSSRNLPAAR